MTNSRPYVLITNDDGYTTDGVLSLVDRFSKDCDVLVVAPKRHWSNAARSSPYLSDNGVIEKHSFNGVDGYTVDASPALCVIHALTELVPKGKKIDACISGVNHGLNFGQWATMSGTLGAAFEANSFGLPAVAVSQGIPFDVDPKEDSVGVDHSPAAEIAYKFVIDMLENPTIPPIIWSLNCPVDVQEDTEIVETVFSKASLMEYSSSRHIEDCDFALFSKPHRPEDYLLSKKGDTPGTDVYVVWNENKVSATPLTGFFEVYTK